MAISTIFIAANETKGKLPSNFSMLYTEAYRCYIKVMKDLCDEMPITVYKLLQTEYKYLLDYSNKRDKTHKEILNSGELICDPKINLEKGLKCLRFGCDEKDLAKLQVRIFFLLKQTQSLVGNKKDIPFPLKDEEMEIGKEIKLTDNQTLINCRGNTETEQKYY